MKKKYENLALNNQKFIYNQSPMKCPFCKKKCSHYGAETIDGNFNNYQICYACEFEFKFDQDRSNFAFEIAMFIEGEYCKVDYDYARGKMSMILPVFLEDPDDESNWIMNEDMCYDFSKMAVLIKKIKELSFYV